uniref:Uncharacterized protein n=1 Tax=Anguilla anguilla TaxID=7936 RepID=A0A0E9QXT0_ANGAN
MKRKQRKVRSESVLSTTGNSTKDPVMIPIPLKWSRVSKATQSANALCSIKPAGRVQ